MSEALRHEENQAFAAVVDAANRRDTELVIDFLLHAYRAAVVAVVREESFDGLSDEDKARVVNEHEDVYAAGFVHGDDFGAERLRAVVDAAKRLSMEVELTKGAPDTVWNAKEDMDDVLDALNAPPSTIPSSAAGSSLQEGTR